MYFFQQIFHSVWWSQNFCLLETVFFYIQLFFLLAETIISSKIRFHLPEWRIFLKHRFHQMEKKLSLKNREKNGFHQPENQLSTSNNKLFETCFPLNSNNGFHQQKSSSDKKTLFPLDRKSFSTSGMKGLVKNAFPIYDKVASTLKNLKISEKTGDRQQEYISSLKIDFPQV